MVWQTARAAQRRGVFACGLGLLQLHATRIHAQRDTNTVAPPHFVELPCTGWWTRAQAPPDGELRCGTVTVPQNRARPNDPRLMAVVLPVMIFTLPTARGTPVVFLPGGPAQPAIQSLQQVFLETPAGQMIARDHPIIAFDRRGYSPIGGGASPDLGTITFEPRAQRDLAIKPVVDSLVRRAAAFRAEGVDPANFRTVAAVDDIADVARALHAPTIVLFGASYGSHEALLFMHRHPEMVDAVVLDGVAPPTATQLLDSAYMATAGRAIADRIIDECRADTMCAGQFDDLGRALATLTDSGDRPLRRFAQFASSKAWRAIEASGPSVLSVLGIAASADEVRANVPRIITELATQDTVRDDFTMRVMLAAAIDPSLQTVARQDAPIAYYVALCGDRPKGEPKGGDRRLCDALGVPFGGPEAVPTVSSDTPTLLISSGYDAQTPAALADSAAKTLTHAWRVHFAVAGHVAFNRPVAMACAAVIIESFLRAPREAPPASCVNSVVPAFLPRLEARVAKP